MKTINALLQHRGTQWQAIAAEMRPSNSGVKSEQSNLGFDYDLIRNGSLYKDSC